MASRWPQSRAREPGWQRRASSPGPTARLVVGDPDPWSGKAEAPVSSPICCQGRGGRGGRGGAGPPSPVRSRLSLLPCESETGSESLLGTMSQHSSLTLAHFCSEQFTKARGRAGARALSPEVTIGNVTPPVCHGGARRLWMERWARDNPSPACVPACVRGCSIAFSMKRFPVYSREH